MAPPVVTYRPRSGGDIVYRVKQDPYEFNEEREDALDQKQINLQAIHRVKNSVKKLVATQENQKRDTTKRDQKTTSPLARLEPQAVLLADIAVFKRFIEKKRKQQNVQERSRETGWIETAKKKLKQEQVPKKGDKEPKKEEEEGEEQRSPEYGVDTKEGNKRQCESEREETQCSRKPKVDLLDCSADQEGEATEELDF